MMRKVDPNSSGQFNLESLENLIRERGKDTDTLEDVVNALRVFDADKDGKISVEEFTYAMVNMGERMSEQEIQEIIADSQLVNNNYIQLEDFARMIMNRIWTDLLYQQRIPNHQDLKNQLFIIVLSFSSSKFNYYY